MRILVKWLMAVGVAGLLLTTPATADVDTDQAQFMGMPWGADISRFPDLNKRHMANDMSYYINPTEIHSAYGQPVPYVVYGFYQRQFCAAFIHIDSPELFDRVRYDMKKKYGIPKIVEDGKQTIYRWKSDNIKIKLKEKQGRMKIAYYFLPVTRKVDAGFSNDTGSRSFQWFPFEKGATPERMPVLRF